MNPVISNQVNMKKAESPEEVVEVQPESIPQNEEIVAPEELKIEGPVEVVNAMDEEEEIGRASCRERV